MGICATLLPYSKSRNTSWNSSSYTLILPISYQNKPRKIKTVGQRLYNIHLFQGRFSCCQPAVRVASSLLFVFIKLCSTFAKRSPLWPLVLELTCPGESYTRLFHSCSTAWLSHYPQIEDGLNPGHLFPIWAAAHCFYFYRTNRNEQGIV